MAFAGPHRIYGSERSFFTRKVQAVYRLMGVPHELHLKTAANTEWLEARAGTHLIPVVLTPEDWVLWDSTPLALHLQAEHPGSAIVPQSPRQRMTCLVIEDWVDEWLTRAAVHSRWCYTETAARAGFEIGLNQIGRWVDDERSGTMSESERAEAEVLGRFVRERFGERVTRNLGCSIEQSDSVRRGFDRLLDALAHHLSAHRYLFGDRPSLADAALLGAFVAHFATDTEPRAWVESRQPQLLDWVAQGWDHVLGEEAWLPDDELSPTLGRLLGEIGREFPAYLTATHDALAAGTRRFELDLGDGPLTLAAAPYKEAARLFVRDELHRMAPEERTTATAALGDLLAVYELPPIDGFHHQSPAGSRHPD